MRATSGGHRSAGWLSRHWHVLISQQKARESLHWDRPFRTVRAGGFETGDIAWFPEGGLNASYNCVDRWAFQHPDKA